MKTVVKVKTFQLVSKDRIISFDTKMYFKE